MKFAFEELEVWQIAMQLTKEIYEKVRSFPKNEDFGLTSQLKRAAVSVTVNIAEGKGRYHTKEYIQFLYTSRGSLYEVITLIKIALELKYLTKDDYGQMMSFCEKIISKLSGLINSMKQP